MDKQLKQFIVIFSIALVISLSIPHISLWGFGVEAGNAAECRAIPIISGWDTKTMRYVEPNQKTSPPAKCTDEYNGDPSNATIGAKADYKLIQAGGKITITGAVSKLCSTCNGYIYTCRAFVEQTCDKNKGFATGIFWDRCTYKDCPADLPTQIHAEGQGTKVNILRVIGTIILIAAVIFTSGGISAVITAVKEIATLAGKLTLTKAAIIIGVKLAVSGDGNPESRESVINFEVKGTQEEFEGCPKCYSICGIDYKTTASRAPICDKGLGTAQVVIDYINATYSCHEGYCGMWENKDIKIEVRDPNGNIAITTETQTDAEGDFSYTFEAPQMDGEFTAIISVPKDW